AVHRGVLFSLTSETRRAAGSADERFTLDAGRPRGTPTELVLWVPGTVARTPDRSSNMTDIDNASVDSAPESKKDADEMAVRNWRELIRPRAIHADTDSSEFYAKFSCEP